MSCAPAQKPTALSSAERFLAEEMLSLAALHTVCAQQCA